MKGLYSGTVLNPDMNESGSVSHKGHNQSNIIQSVDKSIPKSGYKAITRRQIPDQLNKWQQPKQLKTGVTGKLKHVADARISKDKNLPTGKSLNKSKISETVDTR